MPKLSEGFEQQKPPQSTSSGSVRDYRGEWVQLYSNPEARKWQEEGLALQRQGDFGRAHEMFLRAKDAQNKQAYIREDLKFLDTEQAAQYDKLTRSFRTATEQDAAALSEPIQRQTRMNLLTAGLQGGLAESIAAREAGNLASQAARAQNRFGSALLNAQNAAREQFIAGEFSFYQAMQLATHNADLQRNLLEFQYELQRDLEKAQGMNEMFLEIGKTALGIGASFIPGVGPAGAAVGTQVSGNYDIPTSLNWPGLGNYQY